MRRNATLLLALGAVGFAVLATAVAWGTITMDVDSLPEHIATCGANRPTECADRWEYAIGAFWAAFYGTVAVGLGGLAYIVAGRGRTESMLVPWLILVGAGFIAVAGTVAFWGTLFFTEWQAQ